MTLSMVKFYLKSQLVNSEYTQVSFSGAIFKLLRNLVRVPLR